MNAPVRHRIVDPAVIFTRAQVLGTFYIERTLYEAVRAGNIGQTLRWLAVHSLIANSMVCPLCNVFMAYDRRARARDRREWKCRGCNHSRTVRHGSFFARSKLDLVDLIIMIYKWCDEISMTSIMRELEWTSWRTMVDWANFCRDICVTWVNNNPPEIGGITLGGDVLEVEVDETYFFKRKNQVGRPPRIGLWVFGGVERESGKCFMQIVARRNARTLEPIIEQHILPGTIVRKK